MSRRPSRTPGWSAVLAALSVAALAAPTACTSSASEAEPAVTSPSPHRTTPVEICTLAVSYWAAEALAGSQWAGLDWEQKGLTNAQREILDDVVHEAHAVEKKQGMRQAKKFAKEESQKRCEDANGATRSSDNWKPPR